MANEKDVEREALLLAYELTQDIQETEVKEILSLEIEQFEVIFRKGD